MWGFKNYGQTRRAEDRLRILRKLYYNQAEQHQISDLEDILTMKRDAGPRLLKRDKGFQVLPISRRYPNLPDNEGEYEEQFNKPSKVQEIDLQEQDSNRDGPSRLNGEQPLTTTEEYPQDPVGRGMDIAMNTKQRLTKVDHDQLRRYLTVKENIERAILNAGYWQLSIHQSVSDGNGVDGDNSIRSSHRTRDFPPRWVKLVRLPGDLFQISGNGDDGLKYLCRGYGPGLDVCDDSSFLGCLAIAGKFLDAGITEIDHARAETEREGITDIYRLFVRLVKTEWSEKTPPQGYPTLTNIGTLLETSRNLIDAWNKCTSFCGQFTMHVKCIKTCINGHREEEVIRQNTLNIDFIRTTEGLSMEDVINHGLRRVNKIGTGMCQTCSQQINEYDSRLVKPPLRLAVALHYPELAPHNHTADSLSVKYYDDESGKEQRAVYRWLGGIYSTILGEGHWKDESNRSYGIEGSYRVYWTESIRGERLSKNVQIYEPKSLNGMIVGEVVPLEDEPIPKIWWNGTHKPLLFYERVLVPTMLDLQVAAATIGDIMHVMNEKKDDTKWIHRIWAARQSLFFPQQRSVSGDCDDELFVADSSESRPDPSANNTTDSGSGMPETQFQGPNTDDYFNFDDVNQAHNTEEQLFSALNSNTLPTLSWDEIDERIFADLLLGGKSITLSHGQLEMGISTTLQQNQAAQAAPSQASLAGTTNPMNPVNESYGHSQMNMATTQQEQGSTTTIANGDGQLTRYTASGAPSQARRQAQSDRTQQVPGAPLSLPGQSFIMPGNGQSGQAQQQQIAEHSQPGILINGQSDQVQQQSAEYFGDGGMFLFSYKTSEIKLGGHW